MLTSLEHHANLVPWHLVSKKIKIISAKIKSSGELDYNDLIEKINSKTKLIAITHMSNVTGSITNFGLETNTSNVPSDSKLIEDSEIEIIPETLPEEVFEENDNSNSEN